MVLFFSLSLLVFKNKNPPTSNDGSYAILSVEPSSFSSLTRRSLVTVKAASSDAMFVTIIEFLGNFFQCAFIVDFEV